MHLAGLIRKAASCFRFRNAFRAPASQGIVILEHFVKLFPADRLSILPQGFIKKSLWKGVLLRGESLAEIEPSGLILDGGRNFS